ncbi:citrate synthase [Bacillus sp. JCM 19045]|nr:citrate synthase [Bacillus sp. JCM 19045]
MIDDIKKSGDIEKALRNKLEQKEKIMGFGHRVFKTSDPRALALKEVLQQLEQKDRDLELMLKIEQTETTLLEKYKPGRRLHVSDSDGGFDVRRRYTDSNLLHKQSGRLVCPCT